MSAGFLPGLFLPGRWLHCEAFQWPLDLALGLLSLLTLRPALLLFSLFSGTGNNLSTLAPPLALDQQPTGRTSQHPLLSLSQPLIFSFFTALFWLKGLTAKVDLHHYVSQGRLKLKPN